MTTPTPPTEKCECKCGCCHDAYTWPHEGNMCPARHTTPLKERFEGDNGTCCEHCQDWIVVEGVPRECDNPKCPCHTTDTGWGTDLTYEKVQVIEARMKEREQEAYERGFNQGHAQSAAECKCCDGCKESYERGRESTLPDWIAYRKSYEELLSLAKNLGEAAKNCSAEQVEKLAQIRKEIAALETPS